MVGMEVVYRQIEPDWVIDMMPIKSITSAVKMSINIQSYQV